MSLIDVKKVASFLSSLLPLGLILSLPLWELINVWWLARFEVAVALVVGLYCIWIKGLGFIKDPSIAFMGLALCFVGLNIYPLQALLIPAGLIVGEYLVSLNFQWRPVNKVITTILIICIILFGIWHHVDSNFLSFYVACVLVCTNWSRDKNNLLRNILYITLCATVVMIFKSRAFAYAAFIFFIFNNLNIKVYKVRPIYIFILFITIPLFITYGITYADGGIVELFRPSQDSPASSPSFLEKLQNVSDINRFRISRMWVEEYLLSSPRIFLVGMGKNYTDIVEQNNYYPVHNSFIELTLYFGIPYLLAFVLCFSRFLSRFLIKNSSIWFILSFGMVLHGVFYLTLIPFYYLIVKISSNNQKF